MVKPIIVQCRGIGFCAMFCRAVHCDGRRLQVIFWDKNGDVQDRVFEWPWSIMLGSCEGEEDEPVF